MSIVEKGTSNPVMVHHYALRKEAHDALISVMSRLVADTATVSQAAHGSHWNVMGPDFVQYHDLFGEIYEDLSESLDAVAESLRAMMAMSPATLGDMIALRSISDTQTGSDPQSMAMSLLTQLQALLATLNAALAQATSDDEQGVINMLAQRVEMTQKWMWQLRSSLGMA